MMIVVVCDIIWIVWMMMMIVNSISSVSIISKVVCFELMIFLVLGWLLL